jgi:putative ABC transport system substrate-binding protein
MAADKRGFTLSRRQFVRGGSAVGLALLAGCGQPPGPLLRPEQPLASARVPRIGYLTDIGSVGFEVFRAALRDLGYVEGQNLGFEYRDPEGDPERLAEFAAELVRLPVDVIAAGSAVETRAAMQATSTIPIVMMVAPDPVAQGLVRSLSHPGGNVTGTSSLMRQLGGKRLELLKETVPGLSRVALLVVRGMDAPTVRAAADTLGISLLVVEVGGPDDFSDAFATALHEGAEGILTQPHPMLANNFSTLLQAAAASRLPAIYEARQLVLAGGLMSYGALTNTLRRRAAYYVDRILKGAKPADLPVEQPTTFDFVINLKTAQALGLTIPPHVLLQATEVIQ